MTPASKSHANSVEMASLTEKGMQRNLHLTLGTESEMLTLCVKFFTQSNVACCDGGVDRAQTEAKCAGGSTLCPSNRSWSPLIRSMPSKAVPFSTMKKCAGQVRPYLDTVGDKHPSTEIGSFEYVTKRAVGACNGTVQKCLSYHCFGRMDTDEPESTVS